MGLAMKRKTGQHGLRKSVWVKQWQEDGPELGHGPELDHAVIHDAEHPTCMDQ